MDPSELVQNGQAMPAAMLSFGSRSAVGNEVKVVFGGQVMVHVASHRRFSPPLLTI